MVKRTRRCPVAVRVGIGLLLPALLQSLVLSFSSHAPQTNSRCPIVSITGRNIWNCARSTQLQLQGTATDKSTGGSVDPGRSTWAQSLGESALSQVTSLASRITDADASSSLSNTPQEESNGMNTFATTINTETTTVVENAKDGNQVLEALANLERDMQMLDFMAGKKSNLSPLELTLLSMSVLAAGAGPLLPGDQIANFLAPASAAFSASIGISAEYVGKVAVADGKEVAASAIQCAAEAEGLLANAERAKAGLPLCVGVGATCASFALLAPVLIESMGVAENAQLVTELFLCCPLISVLAAAVASLALQETRSYSRQAISCGNRRFAKSGLVGRTWLSSTEQIIQKSSGVSQKWKSFAFSVLPAPLVGALVPGMLPTKAIVVAALAAAQAAFFLAQAEHTISRATDAVALKARSAAVCDTYANQGARSAAVLPFTSALASLCAAATAAFVELPVLKNLASAGAATGTLGGTAAIVSQITLITVFPAFAAMLAAAASVSKARCEVDAEAATQAASTLALEYENGDENGDDPVLQPFRGVAELIKLTASSSFAEPFKRQTKRFQRSGVAKVSLKFWNWLLLRFHNFSDTSSDPPNTPSPAISTSTKQ